MAYWQTGKKHNFGAYANGTANLTTTTNVSYSASENKLTFTNYNATGTNDLVAATANNKTWDGSDTPAKVAFSFKHMLSKIYFTFKTKASKDYIMKVTNLKINGAAEPTASGAIVTATGTLTGDNIAWGATGTNGEYTFGEIADYANEKKVDGAYFYDSSEARFVIPQNNKDLTASFTVTVYDKSGKELMKKDFTPSVAYTADGKGTSEQWTPGFVYNYIAIINPDQVDPAAKPIEFTVTEVEDWTPADNNTIVEPQP